MPTRPDPTGLERNGVFATPSAVRGLTLPAPYVFAYLRTDPADPDANEHVRNAAATLDPRVEVQELRRTRTDAQFAQLRRAMLIGASIVIGLIGLSLLLTALEQLRERRRLLAVLVAFGTRRSTLSWSMLWQSAVPVALGIGIAVATGARARRRAAARPGLGGADLVVRRRRAGGRGCCRGARRHGREPARAVADDATGGVADGVAPPADGQTG